MKIKIRDVEVDPVTNNEESRIAVRMASKLYREAYSYHRKAADDTRETDPRASCDHYYQATVLAMDLRRYNQIYYCALQCLNLLPPTFVRLGAEDMLIEAIKKIREGD